MSISNLSKTTPYMLRNDGKLLECGEAHPYIKSYYSESLDVNINTLLNHPEALEWFLDNTLNIETIKLIRDFLWTNKEAVPLIKLVDKNGITIDDTLDGDYLDKYKKLVWLTNQEFCRVRTSNYKYKYGGDNGEIYFRISSENFNWFDLIWFTVNKFKADIKYITIMKDFATFGKQFDYCRVSGIECNKYPIDEFLVLPGNPVVENLTEDIEKHDELNPKLWENKQLKPEVEEKILDIVNEFLSDLKTDEITINIKDIILIGSNCSYNYNKDSDLDIHIIADTKSLVCPENLYNKIYSAYRSLFNKTLNIDFYGIPVELYVETDEMGGVSNGIYSVLNKQWLKEPIQKNIPDIDMEAFKAEFDKWEARYNKIINDGQKQLEEELTIFSGNFNEALELLNTIITEDISTPQLEAIWQYIDDIYELRKISIATEGEYGIGNLVFKEVRNKGYLDNLKELKNQLISKELSLD